MIGNAFYRVLMTLGSIGVSEEDSEELVLEKRIYTISVEFGMMRIPVKEATRFGNKKPLEASPVSHSAILTGWLFCVNDRRLLTPIPVFSSPGSVASSESCPQTAASRITKNPGAAGCGQLTSHYHIFSLLAASLRGS